MRSDTGPPRADPSTGGKKIRDPPAWAGQLKIFTLNRIDRIVSCRVTVALSERVNLYDQQMLILPRTTRTYAT